MRFNKSIILRTVSKVIAIITTAIVINIAFLTSIGTFSWFTASVESNAYVRAASTSDILESLIVVDSSGKKHNYLDESNTETVHNPEYFEITGKAEGSYKIYFQLEDHIQNSILHINPIEVQGGNISTANINISLNPWDYNELLEQYRNLGVDHKEDKADGVQALKEKNIYGTIYVKYLNNYISRKIPVSFDQWYLMQKDQETINYMIDKESRIEDLEGQIGVLKENEEKLAAQIDKLAGENSSKDTLIVELKGDLDAYSEELKGIKQLLKEYEAKANKDTKEEHRAEDKKAAEADNGVGDKKEQNNDNADDSDNADNTTVDKPDQEKADEPSGEAIGESLDKAAAEVTDASSEAIKAP